ncbi:cytochrome c [bacterium]|jgi:mono/diheme cytochrome c family protein|nr:cytochrome c [bacterium]
MTFKHVFTVAAALVLISGCSEHKQPNFMYMPDMVWSPAFKAQKEGSMRMPVAGTIPREFVPYPFPNDPARAGKELKNPFKRTSSILARGQAKYNVYCIVCHGPNGEGDGHIVPKFPRPPSLQSDKVRTWPDGNIYHVMSMGQNLMPSYASQVSAADRWAIVHYIRALQRSKNPNSEDVKEYAQRNSH